MDRNKMVMDFTEGTRMIYKPLRVLFNTPIYEHAMQICWHTSSYIGKITLMVQLLKLQQKKQIPSEVTAEDMINLLVEKSKNARQVQLWESELEGYDDKEALPLVRLVWDVNTSMQIRDIEFEARKLLDSPATIPPSFQHPRFLSAAQKYARTLRKQQQRSPSSKPLSLQEVVTEVVPKVLQGFWVPPSSTFLNMPSQQLSKMAVGVTKAVLDRVSRTLPSLPCQVTFSRSIRDNMVQSIQEKVRQRFTPDNVRKRLNCSAAEVLNTITDVAVGEICVLFEPHITEPHKESSCSQPADTDDGAEAKTSPAEDGADEPGVDEDNAPIIGSPVITPPSPLVTLSAEPAAKFSLDEPALPPTPSPEPDSAVVSSPPPPLTPLDSDMSEGSSREPDSEEVSPPTALVMDRNKILMDFTEGTGLIYKPIRVLFDTPIYERALQICWHIASYKVKIALAVQFLVLQQKKQIPSEVTAEDMINLLVEESKTSLRVQLWEFELEGYDDDEEILALLRLVWDVNTSMLIRDIEFEARKLLDSPATIPPRFQDPKVLSEAQKYARTLIEQQQRSPSSKPVILQQVVTEVVPKVLQGFWVPPSSTFLNMPSQQLSKMAVGVTKAVLDRVSRTLPTLPCQVTFSHSIRDNMVLSIQEKVRQRFTPNNVRKRLNCSAAEVLNTITDVAVGEICVLFEPHIGEPHKESSSSQPADTEDGAEAKTSHADNGPDEPGVDKDNAPIRGSAVITPPPALVTFSAEPPGKISLNEPALPPTPSPEPDSAVVSSHPPPLDVDMNEESTKEVDSEEVSPPPASLTTELPANNAVEDSETMSQTEEAEQPTPSPEPDSTVVSSPPPPLTPLAEAAATASVLDGDMSEVSSREPDSEEVSPPPALLTPAAEPALTASVLEGEAMSELPRVTAVQVFPNVEQKDPSLSQSEGRVAKVRPAKSRAAKGRFRRFCSRLRKTLFSCFLPKETD